MKKIPIIIFAIVLIMLSCASCESEGKNMQTKYNITSYNEVINQISGLTKDFEIVFISDSHISLV